MSSSSAAAWPDWPRRASSSRQADGLWCSRRPHRSAAAAECRQVLVGGVTVEAGCEFLHAGGSTAKVFADTIRLPTERVFTTAHGDGGPDDKPAPDGSVGQCA